MPPDLKPLKRPPAGQVVRTDSPDDYTSHNAKDRVLFVNLGLIKFGTTDKIQGAAIFLTIVFLLMAILIILFSLKAGWDWAKDVLGWLTTPLMLTVGVAIGRGSTTENGKPD